MEKGDWLPALMDALEPRKRGVGRVPVPFLWAQHGCEPLSTTAEAAFYARVSRGIMTRRVFGADGGKPVIERQLRIVAQGPDASAADGSPSPDGARRTLLP